MNAATDNPMFFNPIYFFDEVSTISPFTSHSNSGTIIPPSPSHDSDKLQYSVYPSSAAAAEAEWLFQHPLDPLSTGPYHDSLFVSNLPHQFNTDKQTPVTSGSSSIDLNAHLDDAFRSSFPSSVAYMDTNTATAFWMMDSLDNTYNLPDFNHALDFYDNNQNDENMFYPNHQQYTYASSHEVPPSHFIQPSNCSHHSNITNFLDSTNLPDEYANFNCAESFPNLPHSFTNHHNAGHEVQSFLGYMPRRDTSPHNASKVLSHSQPPYSSYPPDTNEGMDDLSDSDTTTSTQSWMMPFPQVPFHNCRDNDADNEHASSTTAAFHPIGGMASSISTPIFGFDHHHYNHPQSGSQPMKSARSKKPAKQQQQQQKGRAYRSTSSHTIHYSSSSNNNRRRPSISSMNKQRSELKRRESEPYLLSTAIHSFSTPTTTCFSPATTKPMSASESIASLLSRQRLSDHDDDEEMEENDLNGKNRYHDVIASQHRQAQQKKTSNQHHDRYFAEREMLDSSSSSSSSGDDNDVRGTNMLPSIKKGRNVDKACNHCKRSHLRCDSMRPCRRCISTGKSGCQDVEHKPRGRPRLHNNT